MNWTLSPNIDIGSDRISRADAARQRRTAAEILRRLNRQPGVILADEVGMGKTYVALAVAVSVVEATGGERPVVVMVPPSVREKWPREWDVFREMCLKDSSTWIRATSQAIVRPAPFFKLLDDPARTRNHIIFLTHGALTNALVDPFTRLALIRRALGRKSLVAAEPVVPALGRSPAARDVPLQEPAPRRGAPRAEPALLAIHASAGTYRSRRRSGSRCSAARPSAGRHRTLGRGARRPAAANGAERRAAPCRRTQGTPAGRSGGLATVHAGDGDRAPAPHPRRGPPPEEPRDALRESLRIA